MSYTLGIDLGTTYSVMAIVDESGSPVVLKNSEGSNQTPSVVYIEDEPIVGELAKEYQAFGESQVAAFFKRSMGDPDFLLDYGGVEYDTISLSSLVLKKMKQDAEKALGGPVKDAVITVPAYFNNSQREATVKAGEQAGLNVLRIINEPTAAAIAYGMDRKNTGKVLVYDLGGGTFDVTLASVTSATIDVMATDGDHALGGKDWDDCLAIYLSEQFQEQFGVDPMEDDDAFHSILVSSEKAKKKLTSLDRAVVKVVYDGHVGQYEITKDIFEDVTQHLLERTWNLANQVMLNAKVNWYEVDEVILVGGSTRMPMVADFLEERTGKRPKASINVDEVVACGAAIQAAVDQSAKKKSKPAFAIGSVKKVQDVMSHSLGMVAINDDHSRYINSTIIHKNTPIPATKTRPYRIQTSAASPNTLEVYVTQGESEQPLECDVLGKYVISDITHVQHDQAIIHVAYSYDANGIVQVTATDESTGNDLPVRIESVPEDLAWLDEEPVQEEEVVVEPTSVMMAIDLSYSMAGDPLLEAQKAAKEFVKEMSLEHSSVGVMGFADTARVTLPLISDYRKLMNGIDALTPLFINGKLGYSNKGEPFTEALHLLKKQTGRKFLIVLTDGLWAKQYEAVHLAGQCHFEDIEVIAIGFGSVDKNFLKQIATTDENALATDLTQIVSSFSKIAQVLTESPKSQSGKGALQFFK
ncbi:Hsp70 family protein [Pontibacillus sp. ALD_SL1]|uniref:Hsp70 family protein n=1 Tax=Pontibacillus sp. ALD_SL1 TaxID=2777185 RepID=UPI001A9610C3|nr:Hsp70 family protein [Pontibacillus sp. ALD_SL1]QSS99709.1 Hsp70 family protein [Pontibacillus sp. ALD_SL1]